MIESKIYGHSKITYSWVFKIKSKNDFIESLEERCATVTPELVEIFELILNLAEGFFVTTCVDSGIGTCFIPRDYDAIERIDKKEEEKDISVEEIISALKGRIEKEFQIYAELRALGKTIFQYKDEKGNIKEISVSSTSNRYINPFDPEINYGNPPDPVVIRLQTVGKEMVFHLYINTYTDVWYNATEYEDFENSNSELAELNRPRLLEFLHKIQKAFPDAVIEEEDGVGWEHKEPKITLLED